MNLPEKFSRQLQTINMNSVSEQQLADAAPLIENLTPEILGKKLAASVRLTEWALKVYGVANKEIIEKYSPMKNPFSP